MRKELIRKKMETFLSKLIFSMKIILYFGISKRKKIWFVEMNHKLTPIFVFPVNTVVTLVLFLKIELHKCTFLLVFLT